MFTATPPSVNRRRSGGGRKSLEKEQLPFVATRSSYSYGSQFSNMPKPPQLAETKVPLSVALKQQQDASQARMRAEQLERERIAREQGTAEPEDHRRFDPYKAAPGMRLQKEPSPVEGLLVQQRTRSLRSRSAMSEEPASLPSSMPPPPRRSPRLLSETSDHSYSVGFDTTHGMSRSYASEDDVGVALGRKFTQNLTDLPSDASSATDEDEDEPVDDPWLTPMRGGVGSEDLAESKAEPRAVPNGPPPLPGLVEKEPEEEVAVVEIEPRGKSVAQLKELDPVPKAGEVLGPVPVPGLEDELLGPPKPPSYTWDWVFWHYRAWLKDSILKFFYFCFIIVLCTSTYIYALQTLFDVDIRNLKASPFIYIPPNNPPIDFDEVQLRMQEVEKVISEFGLWASKEQLEFQGMIRSEVELLEGKIVDVKNTGNENQREVAEAQDKLAGFGISIDNFTKFRNQMVKDFEAQRKLLDEIKSQQDQSMESLKRALPDRLVFDQSPDGSVKFPPAFLKALEKVIKATYPSDGRTVIDRTDKQILEKDPDWNDFLAKNERRLKDIIDQHTGLKYDNKQEGVIVGKGTVTRMIDQKVKENGDWAGNVFWPRVEGNFMEKLRQETVLPTLVENAVSKSPRLIENAVRKYLSQNPGHRNPTSANIHASEPPETARLSIPDYASLLTGGKISPWATSPTYEWSSSRNRWFYSIFGRRKGIIKQPTIAITPTNDVGQCWPFAGDSGNIGIKLAVPIFATQISVEHIPKAHAIDISSAPRKIEFWAEFPNEETRNRAEKAASRATGEIEWSKTRLWDREDVAGPPGPSGNLYHDFVKLGSFKYDINRGNSRIQTWDLNIDLMNLNITTRLVIFKIINNWGHPDFTCLYRVRVHGIPQNQFQPLGEEDLDAGKKSTPMYFN